MKCTYSFIYKCALMAGFFSLMSVITAATAQETPQKTNDQTMKPGWSVFTHAGYLHQADADIDSGGRFSVNRFFIEGGPRFLSGQGTSVSLAVGYGLDSYDFSEDAGSGFRKPWEDIHSLRVSIPCRWEIDRQWTGFFSPTLRFTGEQGADFGDAVTGGGFAGLSYRFNDRFSLGPGLGLMTQLEESAQVIPILIIHWKITDTLSLHTGRGIGATFGPGIAFEWRPSHDWSFSLGGRYEKLRFRLDENGAVRDGIGEDRSFPVFAGIDYRFTPMVSISLFGGVEVAGELSLEDRQGNTISEQDHDPAGFYSIAFSARF